MDKKNEELYQQPVLAVEVKKIRIQFLVSELNEASEKYSKSEEIMSNYEWDEKFDELILLEAETGYILINSPTQSTGADDSDKEKEQHEFPALSLAKTKKILELRKWAANLHIWLSWKLDGLTLVLTYDGGKLTKILTRGNGIIGTNISYMKDAIKGFPLKIKYKGHLVVRGEATISYTEFELINATIEDDDDKYANPRNLACGTLSLDDVEKVKERHVTFNAFTLVYIKDDIKSWGDRMNYLEKEGFTVVSREATTEDCLQAVIDKWTTMVETGKMDIPVDGLVICYDDTDYASTGSVTGHHSTRGGYAFKWQDVSVDTELEYIEWSCAASTISPVAVFKPVQIEGTTVSRASLCNISEMERLGIGKTSVLEIIKANKIIPKCISVKKSEGKFEIPSECPVCHAKTEIRISPKTNTKTLRCTNDKCTAKHVKKFTRFVSKSGMNIDGLSMQTILKFINKNFISKFEDIYQLKEHSDEIKIMEGFGEKSCKNIEKAIEKSKKVTSISFLYSLCIPMIGTDAGKKIIGTIGFASFLERLREGEGYEDVAGIGPEKSNAIITWYQNSENKETFEALLTKVTIEKDAVKVNVNGKCTGLIFVITGEVNHYENRDEFKAYVESENGKVTGSVTSKTSYLVNNDTESESGKNQKAKELGVPILSEDEFVKKFGK